MPDTDIGETRLTHLLFQCGNRMEIQDTAGIIQP